MLTATFWVTLGVICAAFIARGVKISEFRQAWIDGLRADISEYICKSHEWADLYLEFNDDMEHINKVDIRPKLERLKYDALHIHNRISLRFKPEDKKADDVLKQLLNLLEPSITKHSNWQDLSDKVVLQVRVLLKEEWEKTKNPFRKSH